MKHACFFCEMTHLFRELSKNSSKPIEESPQNFVEHPPKTSVLQWSCHGSYGYSFLHQLARIALVAMRRSRCHGSWVWMVLLAIAMVSMVDIITWPWNPCCPLVAGLVINTAVALCSFFGKNNKPFVIFAPQETIHVGKFHVLFFSIKTVVPLTSTKDWELFFCFLFIYPPKTTSSTKHFQLRGWLQVVLWFWLSCCPALWKPSTSLSSQYLSMFFFLKDVERLNLWRIYIYLCVSCSSNVT